MSVCGWFYWPLFYCCCLLVWFSVWCCHVARRWLENQPCHLQAEPSLLPSSPSEHLDPGSLSLCASVDAESKMDYEQSHGITLASVLTSRTQSHTQCILLLGVQHGSFPKALLSLQHILKIVLAILKSCDCTWHNNA